MIGFALDAPPDARPRIEHIPAFDHSAADETLDFMDMLDMPLLDWQRYSLCASLGETANGKWAAPWVVEICPRQNGKSYKWAARVLAGLFVLNEQLITYTAHKVDTALEVFRIVEHFALANPQTRRMVKSIMHTTGRENIELVTGQRFKLISRVRSGGRGYSGDCLILDEALELRDQSVISALVPTLAAQPNPQLIIASSAGDPGSVVLRGLRDQGRAGAGDMAYFEYSAPDDADPDDENAWRQANPALGELIDPATLRRNRLIMSEEGFKREHLGIWGGRVSGAIIPATSWQSTRVDVDDEPLPGALGLAFDVAPDRTWASVVVAYDVDRRTHVRMARHRLGDGWLTDELAALVQMYRVPVTYADSGPSRDIGDRLRMLGCEVRALSTRDYATACSRLHSGLVNETITHHPDLALDEAAAAASTRKMGVDSWAFTHKPGPEKSSAPICPIVAAALAVWGNDHTKDLTAPPPRPAVY